MTKTISFVWKTLKPFCFDVQEIKNDLLKKLLPLKKIIVYCKQPLPIFLALPFSRYAEVSTDLKYTFFNNAMNVEYKMAQDSLTSTFVENPILHEILSFKSEIILFLFTCGLLLAGVFSKYRLRPVHERKYTLLMHLTAIFLVLFSFVECWGGFKGLILSFCPFISDEYIFSSIRITSGRLLIGGTFTDNVKGLILITSTALFFLFLQYRNKTKLYDYEYAVLFLFAILASILLVSSGEFISMYLALEMLGFCSYILAAFDRKSVYSAEAGLKYFILGAIASGITLFGLSLFMGIYENSFFFDLHLMFSDSALNAIFDERHSQLLTKIAILFLIVGFLFKVSAAPFHNWSPDVYEGSPVISTAFFATVVKLAGFAFFCKLIFIVFTPFYAVWAPVLNIVGLLSMAVGSLGAMLQDDLKRLAAFSSINHVGFMLVSLLPGTLSAIMGFLFYLTFYTLMNLGFFTFVLSLYDKKTKRFFSSIYDLSAVHKVSPKLAVTFVIILFSLAGIPPLLGFFSKLYVISNLLSVGFFKTAVITALFSVLSAYYYLRVIAAMFFIKGDGPIILEKPTFLHKGLLTLVCVFLLALPLKLAFINNWLLLFASSIYYYYVLCAYLI